MAVEKKSSLMDVIAWIVVAGLLTAGVVANLHFSNIAWELRAVAWIFFIVALGFIALVTKQGKSAFAFAKEAREELRKVRWPARQETVQTTLIVVAAVVIVGLILWGIDNFLLWVVGMLTGQRG